MSEGQNRRLLVTTKGNAGEIGRARVNVFAANEGEAERMAVKVIENQGQKAMALGVGLRTKERHDGVFVDEFVAKGKYEVCLTNEQPAKE